MANHIDPERPTAAGFPAQDPNNAPRPYDEQVGEEFVWPPAHQQQRFDLVLRRLHENWVWMIAVGYLSACLVAGLKLYFRYTFLLGIPGVISFVGTADLFAAAATDVPTAASACLFAILLIMNLFARASRVAQGKLPTRMPLGLALKAVAVVVGLAILPELWMLSRKCEARVFVKAEGTKPLVEHACIAGLLGANTVIHDPYGVQLVPTSEISRIEWARRRSPR